MNKSRNDLEYERFTTSADGNTAVRVAIPDGISVSLTGAEVNVGSVRIENGTGSNEVSITGGNLYVRDSSAINELQALNSLIPSKYDYVSLAYDTNSNLTGATFKLGGITGNEVSSLLMGYDTNSNLTSVQLL